MRPADDRAGHQLHAEGRAAGQEIQGKTPDELAEFSIIVYSIGSQLGLADWILRPGPDALVISTEDMEAAP